ncbi:hypothetical protein BH11VER1_BH11VER1_42110 [soil metagenome]
MIEEIRALLARGESFALESTLSGKAYVALFRAATAKGYRVVLHYIVIGSESQAVDRVALRVSHGGHPVPENDVRRRFERSRKHFLEDYLPLADEWVLWDNRIPPHVRMADSDTHTKEEITVMLTSSTVQETPPQEMSEMARIGLEAGRIATEKMLDYYKRMGIRVTPQMTLAPAPKKRARKANA